jgi:hypothetical protein
MFKSEFESKRVFRDFQNSILMSFFCNFQKVHNITNSEFSINLECSEIPVFDPKTPVFASKTGNYFQSYFRTIFASSKKKISELENKKFGNSVFRRALGGSERVGKERGEGERVKRGGEERDTWSLKTYVK